MVIYLLSGITLLRAGEVEKLRMITCGRPLVQKLIWSSTSPAWLGLFFVGKRDGGLCLCIDYWGPAPPDVDLLCSRPPFSSNWTCAVPTTSSWFTKAMNERSRSSPLQGNYDYLGCTSGWWMLRWSSKGSSMRSWGRLWAPACLSPLMTS